MLATDYAEFSFDIVGFESLMFDMRDGMGKVIKKRLEANCFMNEEKQYRRP